jgi:hypothetical protein
VNVAFNDVAKAKINDIFIQFDHRYIVRGGKSREHIFESNGELITSFVRTHKNHLLKLKTGDRRSITTDEFIKFKELFR